MMNRRRALVAIGITACGGVGSPGNLAIAGEPADTAADRLRADLNSIGSHVYSEEGIPMFLACENLSGTGTASKEAPISVALNQKVVLAFHSYAEEWQRLKPDAPSTDVAKILELVADRDFASGGTEASR